MTMDHGGAIADTSEPYGREAKRRKLNHLSCPSNTLETAASKSRELLSPIFADETVGAGSVEHARENEDTQDTDDHCSVVAADASANEQSVSADDGDTGKEICFGMVSHCTVPSTDPRG
jgi:hypothetical protein